MILPDFPWHVVQTYGGQEKLAHDQLRRRGRTTFFPRAERTILHARRRDTVLKPLYPAYLFVQFDPFHLSWGEILHIPGVYTILGIMRPTGRPLTGRDSMSRTNWHPFIGQPRAVPDGVIDLIKSTLEETEDGYVMREPTATVGAPLAKDTRVIITDEKNAFVGFEGLVDLHEGTRVRVLLDIMGRSTPLIVPRDSLAPVGGVP